MTTPFDPLEMATKTLKAQLAPSSMEGDVAQNERAARTRKAVLDSLSKSENSANGKLVSLAEHARSKRPAALGAKRWILPIAATFFLIGTFAAARSAWNARQHAESVPALQPSAPATTSPLIARTPPTKNVLPVPDEPPAIAMAATAQTQEATRAAADALYYKAHAQHFDERNYGHAVAAWDRYLKESPRGRFAPEAQYNRAMALLHLGRNAEAKAALRPFAQGSTYGSYRKTEAIALLAELGDE
jgi:tetratricopeptide (TPR) repeat protein